MTDCSDLVAALREALDLIENLNGCHGCLDNGSPDDRAAVKRLRALADAEDSE